MTHVRLAGRGARGSNGGSHRRSASALLWPCATVAMAAAALVAGAPGTATAQQAGGAPWNPAGLSVRGAAVLEHYSFDEPGALGIESLSLVTIPVSGHARLGGRVSLDVTARYARGALTASDGTEATIAGLTDTRVELSRAFAGERVVVTAAADLPTGKATHTAEEAFVAGAVAADLLPFRISHWGSGGGFGGSVAVARPVGLFGVGLGAGYFVSGDFEPREGQPARYQPGDMLRVNAVVDRSLGDAKASLRVSWQDYSEDLLDDQNLFQTGDRLEVMGSWSFPVSRRASGIVHGGLLMREGGTLLGTAVTTASQDVLVAGAAFELPAGGGVLRPLARLRVVRPDDGPGEGWVGELGAAGAWRAGGVDVGPLASLRIGSVDTDGAGSSGLLGFEIGLTVRPGR